MHKFSLTGAWRFKARAASRSLAADLGAQDGWLPAQVPGTVHQDLLAAEHIPDPFWGLNEREVQWVGETDWLYQSTFELSDDFVQFPALDLCCEGLDTFATIWINDEQVLTSDNMFVPQRVPVKPYLRPGRNTITIVFESALRRGKEREAQHGAVPVWNGDPSRVYVRKAQYHYGWDWGPCLLTAGIWRDIRLEAYSVRIADVHCPVDVAPDLQRATLPVQVTVNGPTTAATVHLELRSSAGDVIDQAAVPVVAGSAHHSFTLDQPQLWWPRGYGDQPLYTLTATLHDSETATNTPASSGLATDTATLRLGMRRVRLAQESLVGEPGRTFLFEINNTPIFCGGANWIPADSFTPRTTPDVYRAWLEAAANANLVMIRVWGGGIYEEDVFYNACDELGLLVWQDFMFACGLYPSSDWFDQSVRAEAEANIRRLRHHPALVLWCGNNEDYAIAESFNLYDAAFNGDFRTTAFPAREIYERLLPDICATLDPTRPYWPGSPWGGARSDDQTQGDRHTWDVWHGTIAPYQDYPKYEGRFVSEFGMAAAPARATIELFAPPAEQYSQSRTLDWHNKASEGPRRLAVYLNDTLRVADDLDSYIYATQFVQSEALAAAYRGWRRRWAGPGRYAVGGALVWQLNDCWPVTSWAIIDYALRPKAAYYVVRRELAPFVVGLARANDQVHHWVVNGTTEVVTGALELTAWTLAGQQTGRRQQSVTLPPNQALELGPVDLTGDDTTVLSARLIINDIVAARTTLWPEPYKYLTIPDPDLELECIGSDTVRVRVSRPAKGVWLSAGDNVRWSDNMLDLLPDEERTIEASGLAAQEVRVRYLR